MLAGRLLLLASSLRELQPKDFDFSVYFEKRDCGSVCCAIGLAGSIPALKELELSSMISGTPVFHGYVGPRAVEEFFELTNKEVSFLFYPGGAQKGWRCPLPKSASPLDVAQHIEKFVSNGGIYTSSSEGQNNG